MTAQSFEECVARLLEPSKAMIEKMRSDGLDLGKPRHVTHLLNGGDREIEDAAVLFNERGFDILESSNGRLLLGDDVPVSIEWISQIVPAMCSKAAQFGLIYDGWDVDASDRPARIDKQ